MAELGGLPQVLGDATPPEKTAIYQALGLRLVYQPDVNAVVATADLGRVLSRVGGATRHPRLMFTTEFKCEKALDVRCNTGDET